MDQIRTHIHQRLAGIEDEQGVAVLLAVESGSRAWGFPSTDSDFDVRFIYCHPIDHYLSINQRPDVIERPIADEIDLTGWDIRKALQLFRKSNPPILEWLQCPLIYAERSPFASRLRQLLPRFYSPRASYFHYLHMAQGNLRDYLQGETVWLKKYFYVLRPLLAVLWIESGYGPVPMEFSKLVDALIPTGPLRSAVEALLERKKAGEELSRGPRIPTISDFLESELGRLSAEPSVQYEPAASTEELDRLFRETLNQVWQTDRST